ncbi:uncharacterized protein PHACADRAFT_212814 [Phanerochaete carnosa HHB-10118-sp]|uniref:Uncharacterized protein n=1 Tax=Phanerochaete carnosa (strain HHB-10118-sp) TaxID=650164 RepID=K5UMI4_PHACS|nr:uncharacterized protein PHACADRAFT_212814 [Phanerochaete carnosa HHB-10118-sp]EKM50896.1 hypothetical protein PHACADRAFT_212814 [Phanerochaete carnosa HHB-10118-sp]
MKQHIAMDTHFNRHFELRPHKCSHTKAEPGSLPTEAPEPCTFSSPDPSHLSKHRRKHSDLYMTLKATKAKQGYVSAPGSPASTFSFEETPALSDASSFPPSPGPDTPASSDWTLEGSPFPITHNLAPMQSTPPGVSNAALEEETVAFEAYPYHVTEPRFAPVHAPAHAPLQYGGFAVATVHDGPAAVHQQFQQFEQRSLSLQPHARQVSARFSSTSVPNSNATTFTSLPQYIGVPSVSVPLTMSHGQLVRQKRSTCGTRYARYYIPSAPRVGYPMPVADCTAAIDALPTVKVTPPSPEILPNSNPETFQEPYPDFPFDADASASYYTYRNLACNTGSYHDFNASATPNYTTFSSNVSANHAHDFSTNVAFAATHASNYPFNAHPNPGFDANLVSGLDAGGTWPACPLLESSYAAGTNAMAAEVAPQYRPCNEYPMNAQRYAPQDVLFTHALGDAQHMMQQMPFESLPELDPLGLALGPLGDIMTYQGGPGLLDGAPDFL